MESAAAALVHQRKVVPFAHGLCVHAQQRFLAFADRWHNFHQRAVVVEGGGARGEDGGARGEDGGRQQGVPRSAPRSAGEVDLGVKRVKAVRARANAEA